MDWALECKKPFFSQFTHFYYFFKQLSNIISDISVILKQFLQKKNNSTGGTA